MANKDTSEYNAMEDEIIHPDEGEGYHEEEEEGGGD